MPKRERSNNKPPADKPPAVPKNAKPDFDADCGRMGGKLEDIPFPHIHKWPTSKQKRRINISIANYGMVGGRHFTPSIDLEDNPIWNSIDGCWQQVSGDIDEQGPEIRGPRLYSAEDAVAFIEQMLRAFDPDKYVVDWSYGCPDFLIDDDGNQITPKWTYVRDPQRPTFILRFSGKVDERSAGPFPESEVGAQRAKLKASGAKYIRVEQLTIL